MVNLMDKEREYNSVISWLIKNTADCDGSGSFGDLERSQGATPTKFIIKRKDFDLMTYFESDVTVAVESDILSYWNVRIGGKRACYTIFRDPAEEFASKLRKAIRMAKGKG